MNCKKCLHYEVCVKLGKPSLYGINQEIGCSVYKDKAKWAEKKDTVTNADRIRAMSDEELADFFFESPEIEFTVCEYCKYFGGYTSDTPCKHDMGRCFVSAKNEAFKKWLKQPAEENE